MGMQQETVSVADTQTQLATYRVRQIKVTSKVFLLFSLQPVGMLTWTFTDLFVVTIYIYVLSKIWLTLNTVKLQTF